MKKRTGTSPLRCYLVVIWGDHTPGEPVQVSDRDEAVSLARLHRAFNGSDDGLYFAEVGPDGRLTISPFMGGEIDL